MKRIIATAVLAAALVAGGGFLFSQSRTQTAVTGTEFSLPATDLATTDLAGAANAQSATSEPPVVQDMILGNPDAPIEVIEYASYTCPHCASFHANQFKQLKENYIDTGKIKFVYREVYFDRPGLWA
ncbi:MAG: thioredoxin domain-containing protein, partial [Paracoccaceae bacterium]